MHGADTRDARGAQEDHAWFALAGVPQSAHGRRLLQVARRGLWAFPEVLKTVWTAQIVLAQRWESIREPCPLLPSELPERPMRGEWASTLEDRLLGQLSPRFFSAAAGRRNLLR